MNSSHGGWNIVSKDREAPSKALLRQSDVDESHEYENSSNYLGQPLCELYGLCLVDGDSFDGISTQCTE